MFNSKKLLQHMKVYPYYTATKIYDVALYLSAYKYGRNILLGEKSRWENIFIFSHMYVNVTIWDIHQILT